MGNRSTPSVAFADAQGFLLDNGAFVAKEIAFMSGWRIEHRYFDSPFPWALLSPTERARAVWLQRRHHRLAWNADGCVCDSDRDFLYDRLTEILFVGAVGHALIIYIRNELLRERLREVIDDVAARHPQIQARELVEVRTWPSTYAEMDGNGSPGVACGVHSARHCALANVVRMSHDYETRRFVPS